MLTQGGQQLDMTVAAAEAAGAPQAEIGRAVGMSGQSARDRWAAKH